MLGISRRHFDRLVIDEVIPRAAPRLFDLAAAVPAYVRYVQTGKAASSQMAAARLRLVNAQHRSLEQRTLERRRELVERAEVERVYAATLVALSGALEGMPGRLSGTLATIDQPALIHEAIADEVRRTRTAAAAALAELSLRGGSGAPAAATEADGGRVGGGEPRVAAR